MQSQHPDFVQELDQPPVVSADHPSSSSSHSSQTSSNNNRHSPSSSGRRTGADPTIWSEQDEMGQGDIDMEFDGGNDNPEEDRSAGDRSTREPSPAGSVDGAQDPAAPSRINKVYHPTINGQSFTITIG
jgi:hypothetical protein